jgi:Kef-type K+ transport system membrane component KefB
VSFTMLAIVVAVGLLGPLLALRRNWNIPVVLGELLAGVLLGRTGIGYLDASDQRFTFLAEIGFGLVMFVAGTHVPVRDAALRRAIRPGVVRAVVTGLVATALAFALNAIFGTGHVALYAVLMASSSAALILPIVDSLRLGGPPVVELLPQVALADAVCIVALPLAIDPGRAGRAALGALAVIAAGAVAYVLLSRVERNAALAAAQLGVPVAAATVGTTLHVLQPGEPAALIVGALVTIAVSAIAGGIAVRRGLVAGSKVSS